ncbi:MAG: hypothetical protein IK005_05160 [Paludibacteraceae bacterium]|nr:hypothetical protein [Paludibacteraceae bacterium]
MWQEGTELTIKESKIAPFYFPSVIFLAWAFFSGITYFDSGYDDAMLFWGLAVLGISVLWVLIRGKKKPIIVSKEGIRLAEKGLVEWNRIKYTYPKSRKTGKNSKLYLFIEGPFEDREYLIDDYAFDKEDFRKAVNYWSGRKIGSLYDRNIASILNQMATEGISTKDGEERIQNRYEEYRPLFEKEINKEKIVSVFEFIATITAVFLGIKSIYSDTLIAKITSFVLFPTGFYSLFYLVSCITSHLMRKKFQKKPEIAHLPETEISQFFFIAEREDNPSNVDESKLKKIAIICGLIAIACVAILLLGW